MSVRKLLSNVATQTAVTISPPPTPCRRIHKKLLDFPTLKNNPFTVFPNASNLTFTRSLHSSCCCSSIPTTFRAQNQCQCQKRHIKSFSTTTASNTHGVNINTDNMPLLSSNLSRGTCETASTTPAPKNAILAR